MMADLRKELEARMLASPKDNIALVGRLNGIKSELTYKALGRIMVHLSSRITNSDRQVSSIGILSNRKCEAYIAVLCAYFLGIKFVPLNPKFPKERLKKIIALAEIDLIMFDCGEANLLQDFEPEAINLSDIVSRFLEAPEGSLISQGLSSDHIDENSLAYQMFTSGSTGDPKGVPISYGNLNAYVRNISQVIEYRQGDKCSQFFDLSFDLSMHDIFVVLYNGGTIVAAEDIDLMMPTQYIDKHAIDMWFSVPVLGKVASKTARTIPTKHKLRGALFCGEALPMTVANAFDSLLDGKAGVWNLYGPTEATIAFSARNTANVATDLDIAPLGVPFGENIAAILLENGDVVTEFEEGHEGMLLLGGSQVFPGYKPDTGKEAFHTWMGIEYYVSGDLVRQSQSELLYLGREDSQVKIRGFRVELGEIEKVFRELYELDFLAVFVRGNVGNLEICVAYQNDLDIEIGGELNARLPDYMIPSFLVKCDTLPTNVNGKIDRKALAQMYV
jgi:D-alanine--poly(phosphoribitol) ligase subunit 1